MRGAGGPDQLADYNDELDGQEEEDLGGMQDGSGQYDQNQQLILDDQNLDMDDMHDLGPGKAGVERQVQDDVEDDVDEDDREELDLDDIDPALLEAAVQQLAQHRTEGVGE